MKEQELKECFSKIRPSEKLVSRTLDRLESERNAANSRVRFMRGFSYRLASAMCALLVVLGLGAAVIVNPAMIPKETDGAREASEMSFVSGRNTSDTNDGIMTVSSDEAIVESMVNEARLQGRDFAVFAGSVDGCYFGGVTQEDAERGVMYHCTLTFNVDADTVISSDGADLPYIGEGNALQADVYIYDHDTMDMILNSTAGYAYVRLAFDGSEWVVEDFIPLPAE